MLDFADTRYEYFAPKPNRLVIALGRLLNRHILLPGARHRVCDVTVQGLESLTQIRPTAGQRLLFLPNHSTHSDAETMVEAQRRCGVASQFMAAYDVFQRGRFTAWVMQHSGAFSVDRDASDSRAMKQAISTLVNGSYALTIFPEGNVHFTNDRVGLFLEGAAFIAMKAQRELGGDVPVFAVPVSLKLTHTTDARETAWAMLATVAADVGAELERSADPVAEMRRVGMAVLRRSLRQRGVRVPEGDEPIPEALSQAAEVIVSGLEEKSGRPARRKDPVIERVRKVRRTIHEIRTNPEKETEHAAAASWADEAILALRILSYAGDYVAENPTLDRVGETAEKLLEDLYSRKQPPYAERHAYVRINPPINLTQHLEAFSTKARPLLRALTRTFEDAVQQGLDAINAQNPHPGGRPFSLTDA